MITPYLVFNGECNNAIAFYCQVFNCDEPKIMPYGGYMPEGSSTPPELLRTWVGKRDAIAKAGRPIRKTLRPCVEESKNRDTTENLYIEGDNLDVLKLLQESYLGKVKMIYIDPPYNTCNDFVYRDNFTVDKDKCDEDGDLIACFDEHISKAAIREIANRQPLRAVFRDSGFLNSPQKINVFEIFKLLASNTTVRVI